MAAQAPTGDKAFARHLHRAKPDILNGADVPAAVVKAGAGGAAKGDEVVIAAVHAVHEGDIAFG